METPSSGHPLIDVVLWIWFALTALAVAYVAYDQFKGGPEQKENSLAMKTMRWGWVLVTLYTGPFGFIVYWFLHRAPARETPEPSEPPLWEQSVESTIHCVAGDATGILLAAVVTSWLRLPMSLEVIVEYVAGFAVGLFVFQALCMKSELRWQLLARGEGHFAARDAFDECGDGRNDPGHGHPDVARHERDGTEFGALLGNHVARLRGQHGDDIPSELVAREARAKARHGRRRTSPPPPQRLRREQADGGGPDTRDAGGRNHPRRPLRRLLDARRRPQGKNPIPFSFTVESTKPMTPP